MSIIKRKRTRQDRIDEFNSFREKGYQVFERLMRSDRSAEVFDDLFTLCICPGGSAGGKDEKLVEVLGENRMVGTKEKINWNHVVHYSFLVVNVSPFPKFVFCLETLKNPLNI